MLEVSREREIAATPAKLWSLVDEPARLGEWFTFADSCKLLSGVGLGRRQRMYGHWGKKKSEIDQLVVEHVPERLLAWKHEAERLDGKPAPKFARDTHFTIRLEPSERGTRVVLRSRQEPNGFLRGLVIRMFGSREIADNLERSLDNLVARFGDAA